MAGMAVGAMLGAAVFLVAGLLYDRLFSRRAPSPLPASFSRGGDARGAVRVLSTMGTEGPRALLLPLREDGASAADEESLLDAALFPSGPAHRWARLLVANPPGRPAFALDLGAGKVVLETGGVRTGNADLAAAVRARAAALPAHRLFELRVAHAADRDLEVAPGEFLRALVAFPREADPAAATAADLAGEVRLLPRDVATERLRAVLLSGKVDDLADADRAEAPASRGPGGKVR
jgi:hypothetical protein